jgi:uncharacterized membrane protein
LKIPEERMDMTRTAIGGFVAGAAFMYFADPNRGRRRRAIASDKMLSGWHDITNEFDKAGRDLRNRAQGVASSVHLPWNSDVADEAVLVDRVRSMIGREVSHPHAIGVHIDGEGRVVLEGPVLRHELNYLMKSVKSVPGVKEVVSRLEVHSEAGNISSLQGGTPRRRLSELAQENWAPSIRVATAIVSGGFLVGTLRTGSALRWPCALTSAALLGRAIINKPFRKIFGIGNGSGGAVHFEKTMHVDAPIEEVYRYWANFENFPKFMTHLKQVRNLQNGRSHWVAEGPGGMSVSWDAEITQQQENRLIGWTSVPGSMVHTSGSVRFDPEPDGGTRISIRMGYCPPAGVIGHAVAWLFGADPKCEIDDDMVRLKSLIETGKTRAHGVRVTRDQVPAAAAGEPQPQHVW